MVGAGGIPMRDSESKSGKGLQSHAKTKRKISELKSGPAESKKNWGKKNLMKYKKGFHTERFWSAALDFKRAWEH